MDNTALLVALVLAGPALYAGLVFSVPGWLLARVRAAEARRAGLTRKQVDAGGDRFAYFEGGSGEPLVLVHGFGASKDMWPRYARVFTAEYRVICPDMPGFGESSYRGDDAYGIREQVERLRAFVDTLGLGPVHVGGNSMGGAISGVFAAMHPELTRSVLLMNNASVDMPTASDFQRELDAGRNPLIPRRVSDVETLFAYVFGKRPFLPPLAGRVFASEQLARVDRLERIFSQIHADSDLLTPMLGDIRAPVLVMWGKGDRVLDVSVVDTLDARLTGHQKVLYDGIGHIPAMEIPVRSARDHLAFLKQTG